MNKPKPQPGCMPGRDWWSGNEAGWFNCPIGLNKAVGRWACYELFVYHPIYNALLNERASVHCLGCERISPICKNHTYARLALIENDEN